MWISLNIPPRLAGGSGRSSKVRWNRLRLARDPREDSCFRRWMEVKFLRYFICLQFSRSSFGITCNNISRQLCFLGQLSIWLIFNKQRPLWTIHSLSVDLKPSCVTWWESSLWSIFCGSTCSWNIHGHSWNNPLHACHRRRMLRDHACPAMHLTCMSESDMKNECQPAALNISGMSAGQGQPISLPEPS